MLEYKIYPKQFRNEKIPIEKNRCFFIMPFADEFDIIYGEIKAALSKDKYICMRVDDIPGSLPIINKILKEILKAQFVIVDLTGCNPNVFYELGIAHTFKDAQNIFLLKEKESEMPFDIIHLTYLEYDKKNLKHLTARLKQALNENKYISDFYEILNTRGIIEFIHDNQEEFIDILKHLLGDDISLITNVFNNNFEVSENEIETVISTFALKVKNSLDLYSNVSITGILHFYAELLIACNNYSFVREHLQNYIDGSFFAVSNLTQIEKISHQTDMVLAFAKARIQLEIVLPWIISYFKKSKSATIDLNRYKLESFLLTTQHKEVNDAMCNAMLDKDVHIREHLADIIGEKRLSEANDILCKQLLCEKNYYTASSIIEALGKLGEHDSVEYIKQWINEHDADLIATKHLFIFKHIRIAIAKLDKKYLNDFEEKYEKQLKEYLN